MNTQIKVAMLAMLFIGAGFAFFATGIAVVFEYVFSAQELVFYGILAVFLALVLLFVTKK